VSYILDALTKAAQQRDRQVPAVQRLLTRAPSGRSVWGRAPAWLIAALTVNAVLLTLVLGWWSWPSGVTDTATGVAALPATGVAAPPAPAASAPASVAVPPSSTVPLPASAPVKAAPTPAASTRAVPTPASVASPPVATGAPADVERPARREPPKVDAAPEKPVPAKRPVAGGSSPTTAPKRAPEASVPHEPQTAPASPRQAAGVHPAPGAAPPVASVPPVARGVLKLEALIYSDVPAQRMVFVNGRRYVEGDVIDGRFRIEEIQDEGVQLSDQGRRFILRTDR
jgi:Type II secretion system protein B